LREKNGAWEGSVSTLGAGLPDGISIFKPNLGKILNWLATEDVGIFKAYATAILKAFWYILRLIWYIRGFCLRTLNAILMTW
jgi:hypothetical protein